MDFIFGLAPDSQGRTGILAFVDRFSKMSRLIPVSAKVTAAETASHFIDAVYRHHGLPESIISDRNPRFTSAFWTKLFELLGTRLKVSTAAYSETDRRTERVNRVLEDVLCSYATSFTSWSTFLPLVEFSLNNSEHASTGLTPFFVNNARHPRVPALLALGQASSLGGDEEEKTTVPMTGFTPGRAGALCHAPKRLPSVAHSSVSAKVTTRSQAKRPDVAPKIPALPIDDAAVSDFLLHRQSVTRYVRFSRMLGGLSQWRIGRASLTTGPTSSRHLARLCSRLWLSQELTFQHPHPFE
ncbi:unnamed protein product [Peronospora destructor]|uniref:Integrase catalytic domain-containing protein n=1 Tax=Peronospora destructor TaxID=86335 RepID=A0AAV0V8Q6_9STRA|nr:unnamed protein product [Peronospora destructor]